MINFIKKKKQCLSAKLCNGGGEGGGFRINLCKILCGISIASQESSSRSQEEDGSSANRRSRRWCGWSSPSQGGQPNPSYSSKERRRERLAPLRVLSLLLLLLLFIQYFSTSSFSHIAFSPLSSLVEYMITKEGSREVHRLFRFSLAELVWAEILWVGRWRI